MGTPNFNKTVYGIGFWLNTGTQNIAWNLLLIMREEGANTVFQSSIYNVNEDEAEEDVDSTGTHVSHHLAVRHVVSEKARSQVGPVPPCHVSLTGWTAFYLVPGAAA
ncbi:hypothetical protein ACLOJK_010849 [Asimina triloba]